jgi:hypothetical protein
MIRIVLVVLLCYVTELYSQENSLPSLFDSLYQVRDVRIKLTYPFDSVYKQQQHDIESTITLTTSEGVMMNEDKISLNIRGKFRRITCHMPPLMLNLKKSTLRELGLHSMDEMKLVTHCIEGPEGQENLHEEMLCYQLYEHVTPYAYRTIWVHVEYCDTQQPDSCVKSGGILIEPDKSLERRLGVQEKRLYNVAQDSLYFDNYAKVAAFNFLVGNRDWSIVANRNAKLFYHDSLGKYIVIPYDFDYANLVAAKYRKETLPEEMLHPYDRIYAGEYYETRTAEILQRFYQYHTPFMEIVRNAKNPLSEEKRKRIGAYLDHWFTSLQKLNPNKYKYGLVCYYKGGL